MSDKDHRLSLADMVKLGKNVAFRDSVQRRCGFIDYNQSDVCVIDPHKGSSPDDEAVKMSSYDTELTAKHVRRKSLFFTTCYHVSQ